MAKIHPGATLTPHFRDFLPAWLAGQSWYAGTGTPAVRPVGAAEARSVRRSVRPVVSDQVTIEVIRIPIPPPDDPDVAGLLIGTWHPDPDSGETASGCLAVVRLPQTAS